MNERDQLRTDGVIDLRLIFEMFVASGLFGADIDALKAEFTHWHELTLDQRSMLCDRFVKVARRYRAAAPDLVDWIVGRPSPLEASAVS